MWRTFCAPEVPSSGLQRFFFRYLQRTNTDFRRKSPNSKANLFPVCRLQRGAAMDKSLDQKALNRIVVFGIAGWLVIVACAIAYSFVASRARFDPQRLHQVAVARKAAELPATSLRMSESALPRPSTESGK